MVQQWELKVVVQHKVGTTSGEGGGACVGPIMLQHGKSLISR